MKKAIAVINGYFAVVLGDRKFICQSRISVLILFYFGAIAQLGERLHGMQEVVGSNPIGSTLSIISELLWRERINVDAFSMFFEFNFYL